MYNQDVITFVLVYTHLDPQTPHNTTWPQGLWNRGVSLQCKSKVVRVKLTRMYFTNQHSFV